MQIIDTLNYGNPDTLHAMVLFYILSSEANCDAINWYQGNVVRLLYPRANMTSQRISDFLAAIGTPEKQFQFQKAYIRYVMSSYNTDRNIMIDSSGLPNGNHTGLTAVSNHNGVISNEIRLIFVVQLESGIPLYYQAIPGNIVDVTTLERTLCHLSALGINISSCIMDAGYNCADNLDLFYNEDGSLKIEFMTRVKAGDATFKRILKEELATLESGENFVQYANRYLFIKKRKVSVGSGGNKKAWMYVGLDCPRKNDELHKLFRRAERNSLSQEDVYEAMQHQGIFALITGTEYTIAELLPAYYQRQSAEQIFDFAKNYTKLLPLRIHSEETFSGHLLLSYIGSCTIKMLQNRPKENYYHGFINGLLANGSTLIEEQKSNFESGNGYIDLIIKSEDNTKVIAILELKQTSDENEDTFQIAEDAIEQIIKKKYADSHIKKRISAKFFAMGCASAERNAPL